MAKNTVMVYDKIEKAVAYKEQANSFEIWPVLAYVCKAVTDQPNWESRFKVVHIAGSDRFISGPVNVEFWSSMQDGDVNKTIDLFGVVIE